MDVLVMLHKTPTQWSAHLRYHFSHFFFRRSQSEIHHRRPQFGCRDTPVVIQVELIEGFAKLRRILPRCSLQWLHARIKHIHDVKQRERAGDKSEERRNISQRERESEITMDAQLWKYSAEQEELSFISQFLQRITSCANEINCLLSNISQLGDGR